MESDPIRWKDDASIDPSMRDDLSRAIGAGPPSIDVAAGAAKLESAIKAGGVGGLGGAGPWIAGAIAAVILGGGGTAIWFGLNRAPERAPRTQMVRPAERTPTNEANARPIEHSAEREVAVQPPAPLEAPTPRRRPEPSLQEEMLLVARARSALRSDPARALALSERARRRFPSGMLAEERESIAILALDSLDRDEEAQRRGARFLQTYPQGPYADRVRRALGPPP